MLAKDYIFTPKGRLDEEDFCDRFGGGFFFYEPDGQTLHYELGDQEREIPDDETAEAFAEVLAESRRRNQNLVLIKYPVAPPMEYRENCDY